MLEAADLECERGGRVLFQKLLFSLAAGESMRIAGANGSGKTSLLRILCGLLRRRKPGLKDELTAAENLEIACMLAGHTFPRRTFATR